jgi:hypothetical protein
MTRSLQSVCGVRICHNVRVTAVVCLTFSGVYVTVLNLCPFILQSCCVMHFIDICFATVVLALILFVTVRFVMCNFAIWKFIVIILSFLNHTSMFTISE